MGRNDRCVVASGLDWRANDLGEEARDLVHVELALEISSCYEGSKMSDEYLYK